MKVSDAIASWLKQYTKHVFCISGGASLHLIHSLAKEGVTYVCPQSEQAASFAADSYARLNGFGCAIATSGPGATNLITGLAASYYDSVPCLYITGNQTRARLVSNLGLEDPPPQYGFQETPIVEVVSPICKWAHQIKTPEAAIHALQAAFHVMQKDRPGPVLLDFCDDIQRAEC